MVGMATLAERWHPRAIAMEMSVWVSIPTSPAKPRFDGKVKMVRNFDEFLSQIDVITFHVPGGEGTKHLLNRERLFSKCHPEPAGGERCPRRSGG